MAIVKLKTQIEVEMDIEFPVHKIYGGFVRVISETEYIRVDDYSICHYTNMPDNAANIILSGRDITEAQFMEALCAQVDKFTEILSLDTQKCFLEEFPCDDEDDTDYEELYADEEIIRVHSEIFGRNSDISEALNDLDIAVNEHRLANHY